MNPNTNELINTTGFSVEEFKRLHEDGFVEVPMDLQQAAKLKLGKKKSAHVAYKSGGKLSKWAEQLRKNIEKGKAK